MKRKKEKEAISLKNLIRLQKVEHSEPEAYLQSRLCHRLPHVRQI